MKLELGLKKGDRRQNLKHDRKSDSQAPFARLKLTAIKELIEEK